MAGFIHTNTVWLWALVHFHSTLFIKDMAGRKEKKINVHYEAIDTIISGIHLYKVVKLCFLSLKVKMSLFFGMRNHQLKDR